MIYERHELLSKGLVALGVDPKVATEDACRIEHVISAESFAAIKNIFICQETQNNLSRRGSCKYIKRTGYRFCLSPAAVSGFYSSFVFPASS